MSRIARLAVLVTALSSSLITGASTAGAVTWHNTGSTTFHATGGPGTLSIGGNSLVCNAITASGTVPASTVGSTLRMSGTATYGPCTLVGQSSFVHCGFTLTGTSFVAGPPSQTAGVADVTCDVRLTSVPSVKFCHIEGTTPITYFNSSGANPGRFTLSTSGTGLVATHASGTSCLLGTGTAHLSERTVTVTSVVGSPVITRTA